MPQTYFTFQNLYQAYIDCRKHKNKTYYHRLFAHDLEKNLCSLERRLQNRTYRPISDGVDFLGYVIRPDYILVRKRVVHEWRYKMEQNRQPAKRRQIFDSYAAHAQWANAFWLQRTIRQNLKKAGR